MNAAPSSSDTRREADFRILLPPIRDLNVKALRCSSIPVDATLSWSSIHALLKHLPFKAFILKEYTNIMGKAKAKAEKESKKKANREEWERREREKATKLGGAHNFGDAPMVQSQSTQVTERVWTNVEDLKPVLAGSEVLVESFAYYEKLASAYCRSTVGLPADTDANEAIIAGMDAKLPHLYRFKRHEVLLPRVKEVLGVVKSFGVTKILDVASQRGALLWPLLDNLDGYVDVTAIDIDQDAVAFLSSVGDGDNDLQLTAVRADVTDLQNSAKRDGFASFPEESFECTICSEILEHLSDPMTAAQEMLRVSSNLVVCTVPAQPDDNVEHIQLFYDGRPHPAEKITRSTQKDQTDLRELWLHAGASSVKVRMVHDGPISVLLAVIRK